MFDFMNTTNMAQGLNFGSSSSGMGTGTGGGGFGSMLGNMGYGILGSQVAEGAKQKKIQGPSFDIGSSNPWEQIAQIMLPRNQFQDKSYDYYLGGRA